MLASVRGTGASCLETKPKACEQLRNSLTRKVLIWGGLEMRTLDVLTESDGLP